MKSVSEFTLGGSCQAARLFLYATDPNCLKLGAAHVRFRLLCQKRLPCTVVVLALS